MSNTPETEVMNKKALSKDRALKGMDIIPLKSRLAVIKLINVL